MPNWAPPLLDPPEFVAAALDELVLVSDDPPQAVSALAPRMAATVRPMVLTGSRRPACTACLISKLPLRSSPEAILTSSIDFTRIISLVESGRLVGIPTRRGGRLGWTGRTTRGQALRYPHAPPCASSNMNRA